MKKKLIPVLVLAAVAAGLLAMRAMRSKGDGRILLSGNIELTRVDIAFKTSGKLVERAVDEGDDVRAGQVLARLDREQLERQRQAQVAALALAEAQLAQARTAVRWQREAVSADVEGRRAELGAAQARLEELRAGSRDRKSVV